MPTPTAALSLPGPRPWIMAHRGASDLAPENSAAAFALAVEHGADLVETDLWCTSDESIVCHHDATLSRMSGDPRRVDAISGRELQRLRLRGRGGYADERVPSLEELVAMLPERVALILEIKDPTFARPERARRLVETLGVRVQARTAGVIATDLALLARLKALAPGLITGHIAMYDPIGNASTDLLGPYWPLLKLNPWYVKRAHRRGQRVCPLDPGLHRRLSRYLALDVDALLTNDPRETRARVEALRRPSA